MTQLVELQQTLADLHANGYQVYAVSNDTVDRLADFAARQGITYPLLSDEDSAVIRRYGIMNTLIRPDEGRSMRWYGIPYPGTYVTGPDGVISHKSFHRHHAVRASGASLLHTLTGVVEVPDDAPAAHVEGDQVSLDVRLLDTRLRLEVLSTLVCRIRVRDDLHLYAPGSPDGFLVTALTVGGTGIRALDASWPAAGRLRMEVLDLEVSVPVTATSELLRLGHGMEVGRATIDIALDYQACNEDECFLPGRLTHQLDVDLDLLVEPDGLEVYVERLAGEARRPVALPEGEDEGL